MSGHTQQKLSNRVVTSDAIHGSKRQLRKWLVMIVAVFFLVVVIAILYEHYSRRAIPLATTADTHTNRQSMTQQQQLDVSLAEANTRLSTARSSSERAQAYKELGTAYFNKNDYVNAITAYNNAINTDSSIKPDVLDTLAYAYVAAGQRDKAIATYQELITELQHQSNDGHEAIVHNGGNTIEVYQHNIQTLQQGGTL